MQEAKFVYRMLLGSPTIGYVGHEENIWYVSNGSDMENVRLVDDTIDYGNTPFRHKDRFKIGRPVKNFDQMPTKLHTTFPADTPDIPASQENETGRLHHVLNRYDALIVSGDFHDAVERIEPGKHQFAPLVYDHAPDYRFYWFVPNTRLLCPYDPELSYPKMKPVPKEAEIEHGFVNPFPDGPAYVFDTPRLRDRKNRIRQEDWRLVFRREAIGDHHLFYAMPLGSSFFVTDVMRAELEKACPGDDFSFDLESDIR